MKQFLLTLLLCLSVGPALAQSEGTSVKREFDDAFMRADSTDTLTTLPAAAQAPLAPSDSLSLPLPWLHPLRPMAFGLDGYHDFFPTSAWGQSWRLHAGFNAQFSMSLTAGLGKRAPRGVGFGQSTAFAYLLPLSPRWAVGAGLYAQNFDWGSWHTTDVGFSAMGVYRPSERINLYGYVASSFLPRQQTVLREHWREPFPLLLDRPQTRIGAAAEFKVGERAIIGVSVEHRTY